MINLIIPFIAILWLLRANYRNKHTLLSPSSFIFSVFSISFTFSFLYVYLLGFDKILAFENIEPVIFFTSALLLYLWALYRFNETKINTIVLPSADILNILTYIVIISSLISVIYFLPIAIKGFSLTSIVDTRNEIRTSGINPFITESILNTFASSVALFYQLPILLFFISILRKKSRITISLLFISSFSYVLYVFAYLGRDGILFWMFSFIGVYLFFQRFLQASIRKGILTIFSLFSSVGLFGFIIISISRFGSKNQYKFGVLGGVVDYLGQTISNFCAIYNANITFMYGGYSFAYYRNLLGLDEVSFDTFKSELASQNVPSWVWGTFLRSFYTDFGVAGVYILGFIFYFIFTRICIKEKANYFYISNLILYFLYFQIFSQGVFYFRQYTRGMNLNILLTFLVAYLLLALTKTSKNKIILKSLPN